MPSANHAITGSGGSYCCCCSSAVGAPIKVQPTNVDSETWCPRCFVWLRSPLEPGRFNASNTAAVQCVFCGFASVSFTAGPMGRRSCGHCGRPGAMLIKPKAEDMKDLADTFQAMRERMAKGA